PSAFPPAVSGEFDDPAGGGEQDLFGGAGEPLVEAAEEVAEEAAAAGGRDDAGADLVGDRDQQAGEALPGGEQGGDACLRRLPGVGGRGLVPHAALAHHPGQPGSRAVQQDRGAGGRGAVQGARGVQRLLGGPPAGAAGAVRGDPRGPVRVALGARAGGDVDDLGFGEQPPLRLGGLPGPGPAGDQDAVRPPGGPLPEGGGGVRGGGAGGVLAGGARDDVQGVAVGNRIGTP